MAKILVDQGLQMIADRASGVAGAGAAIASMSIDDSANAFAAGDTALNSGGAVSNEADANFTGTPTRSGQTVTHIASFAAGTGTMTIKRIALHNAAAASVSSSSTTLIAGVDGQSLTKPSDLALTITLKITYTSV